ncbi:MAG: DUF1501 domain-containing protein [Pirellulaceae bacterium]
MLQISCGTPFPNCQGLSRRTAIKAGFLGLAGLSLGDLNRLRAEGQAKKTDKSVILIWLDGGPSQLESYDPKPDAPSEYRGPFGVVKTNVPGIILSDTLPRHAKLADKMAFVRSVHHGTGDHFAAGHWMLTGRFGSTSVNLPQKYPSVGSYISRAKGPNQAGMPAYVGLPAAQSIYLFPGYQGAAYLGGQFNPFDVNNEEKYLGYNSAVTVKKPKCLEAAGIEVPRLEGRKNLLTNIDGLKRQLDRSGQIDSIDRHQQNALSMILGERAREAFDISKEDPKIAETYGKSPWGQYTLMARRLVESGVTFVTVDMPHWDDHSNIAVGHGTKLEAVDIAVSALIADLSQRGILDRVLVMVMGEFGRTPRINNGQPGIAIPGRDHWGDAISVLLAGGGLKGGTVIGQTNAKAEFPVERPLKPHDLLATVYKVMGINTELAFNDLAGRPVPILTEGEPIKELF